MVVLNQFFPKCIFYTYDEASPKIDRVLEGFISAKQGLLPSPERFAKRGMNRPHVRKHCEFLYDFSYGLIINCNKSTLIILSDLMKGTRFQTNACK